MGELAKEGQESIVIFVDRHTPASKQCTLRDLELPIARLKSKSNSSFRLAWNLIKGQVLFLFPVSPPSKKSKLHFELKLHESCRNKHVFQIAFPTPYTIITRFADRFSVVCSYHLTNSASEPIRLQCLETCKPSPSILRTFSTTPIQNAKSKIGARAHRHKRLKNKLPFRDPYTLRLAASKKAAAVARQERLDAEREEAKGDPIHGAPSETPFVQSLKLGMPAEKIHIPNTEDGGAPARPPGQIDLALTSADNILASSNTGVARPEYINDFLTPDELQRFAQGSAALTRPQPSANRDTADPQAEAEAQRRHAAGHAIRTSALARILAVENASSRQRQRINTTRIVQEFGRHSTDVSMRGRVDREGRPLPPKERVGPDTGSSEVQIGILTSKIKVLAAAYQEGSGKNDKVNKRNLRLLLHRRQKLLRYFWRKDRGGDRWSHLVEKLGLTPATWEGEIEVR